MAVKEKSLYEQVYPYGSAAYRLGSAYNPDNSLPYNALTVGAQVGPVVRSQFPYGPQTQEDQPIVNVGDNVSAGANTVLGAADLYSGVKNKDIKSLVRGGNELYTGVRDAGFINGGYGSQISGGASAVVGASDIYNGVRNKDYVQAGTGAVNLGAGVSTASGILDVAGPAAAAVGAIQVGKTLLSDNMTPEQKAQQAQLQGTKAALAYSTGGVSAVVDYGLQKLAPGVSKSIDKAIITSNKYTLGTNLLIEPTIKLLSSHKSEQQGIRDVFRKGYQEAGLLDENFNMELADGTKFNFGKDGKKAGKIQNYESDTVKSSIMTAKLLAALDGAYGEKNNSSLATGLVNAATSNAKDQAGADANFKTFFSKRGIKDPAEIKVALDNAYKNGNLKEGEYGAYTTELNRLFNKSFSADGSPKDIKQLESDGAKERFLKGTPTVDPKTGLPTTPTVDPESKTTLAIDPGGVPLPRQIPAGYKKNINGSGFTKLTPEELKKPAAPTPAHKDPAKIAAWNAGGKHSFNAKDIISYLRDKYRK